jgi:hypothetical protein
MAALGYLTEYLCYVMIVLACKCMREEVKRFSSPVWSKSPKPLHSR